jgi:hypothetical protein
MGECKMGRKTKSHIQFVAEIENMYGIGVYEFLTEYKNSKSSITVKHLNCGYTWTLRANIFWNKKNHLKKGRPPCPNCNTKPADYDSIVDRIKQMAGKEFVVINNYINCTTKIKIKHVNNCGYEFEITPKIFMYKRLKCPKCKRPSLYKESVHDKLSQKYGNEYVLLDEYVDSTTKMKFQHNTEKCNEIFYRNWNHFYSAERLCPCTRPFSKGEDSVMDFLDSISIEYKKQYTFHDCKGDFKSLPFDFSIFNEDDNIICLIEYDGRQHYEPVNFGGCSDEVALQEHLNTFKNDQIKNEYCRTNNIPLLRIPYWEFDNIPNVIEDFLLQLNKK